jgi:Phage integrase, N-terminal SAM-like domain/XamI restriction endonuclease
VTRLRKMMLEELQRRNYSEHTTRYYVRTVEDFARRFNRPPDRLGPRHIREYQAELFQKRKLSSGTVTIRLAALRFFYIKTLKKTWSIAETPYPKRALHFPSILSQEEVTRLVDSALTPYHRILLMTLYATRASVDQFNQWFMKFAPKAYRETRKKTIEDVEQGLSLTKDLTTIKRDVIKANPGILPTLRMSTCPPLARDRLIGLADSTKNLVGCLEEGKLPPQLAMEVLDGHLDKISGILDFDTLTWPLSIL